MKVKDKTADKCIFDNRLYCKHYSSFGSVNKFRCVIDRYKCDNLKFVIGFGVSQSGLTDLIFTRDKGLEGEYSTLEGKHKETDIMITHNISVDSCIAEEIKRLNDKNDILTLSSCCGHGYSGYIVVDGSYSEEMIKLGYEMTTMKYWDNDMMTDDRIVMCAFKPKSKCICQKNEKNYDEQINRLYK